MIRLYRIKIFRGNEEVFDGFYEGRILRRMKEDALKSLGNNDNTQLEVSHTTLTNNPKEFYKQLSDAEAKSHVQQARLKGIGHRWAVVKKS
jgi:hypothetical protein